MPDTSPISIEQIHEMERTEIKAFTDIYRSISPELAQSFGIEYHNLDSALVSVASGIDILAFNRVIGLGLEGEVDNNRLEEIISRYKKAGVPRFFVQLCVEGTDLKLPNLLKSHGFTHYNNWVRLYRPIEPMPIAQTDLTVKEITRNEAERFGEIVQQGFDWPEPMKTWLAATVSRQKWIHYMAYEGTRPVATAAVYINGKYAWIDMAATLEEYRGRGAQNKLLERRFIDAADAGCEWVVVETAQQTEEKEAPSYRNMIRNGFKIGYIRPNYIKVFE